MKKIAIGIINTSDQDTFIKCKKSLPDVDFIYDVHHTTSNIKSNDVYNRYIGYGGLRNIILRKALQDNADYIFLIKSTLNIVDHSIIQDYIQTAKTFGTWFMLRGSRHEKCTTIEDDSSNINLSLFKTLNQDLIFMLPSHIKNCGFFNEGYINIDGPDDTNCLEIYEYYSKIENKINYLPKGYYPDADFSLTKIVEVNNTLYRPGLKENTTDNITKVYGQFYHNNKFIPRQYTPSTKEVALSTLEKIQQIYSIK